jgi:hypothetical protein
MRSIVMALVMATAATAASAAHADVSAPAARAFGRDIQLPGWQRPVHFGMTFGAVQKAAGVALKACDASLGEGGPCFEVEVTGAVVAVAFDQKQRLKWIGVRCDWASPCEDDNPVLRRWVAETGTRDAAGRVLRGVHWDHDIDFSEETGDGYESFTLTPR